MVLVCFLSLTSMLQHQCWSKMLQSGIKAVQWYLSDDFQACEVNFLSSYKCQASWLKAFVCFANFMLIFSSKSTAARFVGKPPVVASENSVRACVCVGHSNKLKQIYSHIEETHGENVQINHFKARHPPPMCPLYFFNVFLQKERWEPSWEK